MKSIDSVTMIEERRAGWRELGITVFESVLPCPAPGRRRWKV